MRILLLQSRKASLPSGMATHLCCLTRNSQQPSSSIRLGDSIIETSFAPLPPPFGKQLSKMIQDSAEQDELGASIVPTAFSWAFSK
jgi:hypothetical protein